MNSMQAPRIKRRKSPVRIVLIALSVLSFAPPILYLTLTDALPAYMLHNKYQAEVKSRGYYATLDEYKKSVSVRPDENAAAELKPIIARYAVNRENENSDGFREFLATEPAALRQLEVLIADRPRAIFEAHMPDMPELDKQYLGMRGLAVMLCGSARRERVLGNSESALRNWKIAAKLADYADDHKSITGNLVRAKLTRILNKFLRDEDKQKPFSPAEANQILNGLRVIDKPIDFHSMAKTEHCMMVAIVESQELGEQISPIAVELIKKIKKYPLTIKANLARIHEGYLEFDKALNGDDIDAFRKSFSNLEVFSNRKGFSYSYMRLSCVDFIPIAKALYAEHDVRQKLFAMLEKRAGKPTKRLDAAGKPL
jgi:hypothetical protein